jgi:hypothetical protein
VKGWDVGLCSNRRKEKKVGSRGIVIVEKFDDWIGGSVGCTIIVSKILGRLETRKDEG